LAQAVTVISFTFEHAITNKWVGRNPVRHLDDDDKVPRKTKKKQAQKVFKKEQLPLVIQHCDEPLRTLVNISLRTGLRISEVCGLIWSDIEFDDGVIRVTHQKAREGSEKPHARVPLKTDSDDDDEDNAPRVVDLSPELRSILLEHRRRCPGGPNDFVGHTRNRTPYSQRNVSRWFADAMVAAGLNEKGAKREHRYSFQALRHTFVSAHIKTNGKNDIAGIAQQAGHSIAVLQKTYAHEFKELEEKGAHGRNIDRA
jgi:integrase